ncbi:hypothetical protein [Streptomyces iconiensis]|uniref:Uncharacterized protein n=1 Tax=Streptomyces iconiensis TaxID=1384038 RepID=A0ABT6ZS88_9ACTN|nr:hypothetical protein [Streptomyces iconiensis]MDJ1131501.1 hypothetical protein [Streptomyces iconiensis]
MNHRMRARPVRGEASAMFLELLQALGTFFGGLGALAAATTQLLTFLKKNNEEAGSGERAPSRIGPSSDDHSCDDPGPWMIPAGPVLLHLAAAA